MKTAYPKMRDHWLDPKHEAKSPDNREGWGMMVLERDVKAGDEVLVRARSGKEWTSVVGKVLKYTDEGVFCSVRPREDNRILNFSRTPVTDDQAAMGVIDVETITAGDVDDVFLLANSEEVDCQTLVDRLADCIGQLLVLPHGYMFDWKYFHEPSGVLLGNEIRKDVMIPLARNLVEKHGVKIVYRITEKAELEKIYQCQDTLNN